MAKLLYQGHGSFRLTTGSGKVIYIDPFAGKGYDKPADLILVTHQHHDHNKIDLPPHNENCVIYQNTDALKNGVYQTADIADVHIEAVEAYNKNHNPAECVGYLVTADGLLIYFAGDTSRTKQMETFAERGIDYAFLPCDGMFNMGINEAIECADLINAKHSVPVHMSPGKLFSEKKAKKFTAQTAFIVAPDNEITL